MWFFILSHELCMWFCISMMILIMRSHSYMIIYVIYYSVMISIVDDTDLLCIVLCDRFVLIASVVSCMCGRLAVIYHGLYLFK